MKSNITVHDNYVAKKVPFKSLLRGDTFYFGGGYFVKTDIEVKNSRVDWMSYYSMELCRRYSNCKDESWVSARPCGTMAVIADDSLVELVDIEMIIKEHQWGDE